MSQEATLLLTTLATVSLLLLTALFTIGKSALYAERDRRIEGLIAAGTGKADAVLQTVRELKSQLATADIGVILGLIGLGWTTSLFLSVAPPFQPVVAPVGVLCFLVSAGVYAAFGQVLPRSLAADLTSNTVGRLSVKIVSLFRIPFVPLVKGVELIARAVLRLLGRYVEDELKGVYTDDGLASVTLRSHRFGVLGAAQRELLGTLFNFRERTAGELLTPRQDMACVYGSMRVGEALEAVRQFGFTRYPVCDGTKDRVIGTIHFRDLVDAADANPRQFVTDVMDTALLLSETLPISEVLSELHRHRAHMAIIQDGHDGIRGLLTTDDVLREIFGEPETGDDAPQLESISRGSIEFDGGLIVEEVEDALGVELGHAGLETIGSFVFGRLGRKAQEGDSLKVQGVLFDVLQMKGARITRLRAQRTREIPPDM